MIPPSEPDKMVQYLDNLNIEKEVDEYFLENDKNNSGLVDADNYKNIFTNLNKKIGVPSTMGKKEWDWVLNLIKKKSGDSLNKKEAIELFNHMKLIGRDYLCSLPNCNISNSSIQNNASIKIEILEKDFLKLLKDYSFEDAIKGKSINTMFDLDNGNFIVTTGERGKILLNKSNYEVISFKKELGFYVCCKVNDSIISAINTDTEGSLWYSDLGINKLEQIEMEKSEMHKNWISKIIQISENKIATSSGDNTIKIWELVNEKKVKLIKSLNKHKSTVISIIKIKSKNWLVSVSYDNKLIIWDLNKYTVLKEINDIHCNFINGIKELPKQRLIVSNDNSLILINYISGKIIKKIDIGIKSICFEIMDDSTLLVGCIDGSYLYVNMKDFNIKLLKEKESNYISSMMKLDNKTLAAGLHNGVLKIYNLLY